MNLSLSEAKRRLRQEYNWKYPCPNAGCDDYGTITTWKNSDGDPEPEAEQCQYCFLVRLPDIEERELDIVRLYQHEVHD